MNYIKRFAILFISYTIVAVPVFIIVFSILPRYTKFVEYRPLHVSALQGLIWSILMTFIMLLIQGLKKNKKNNEVKPEAIASRIK